MYLCHWQHPISWLLVIVPISHQQYPLLGYSAKRTFMQNVKFIDFLKLRASWGIINLDYIPAEGYWNQKFTGGNIYIIGKDNNNTFANGWEEGRLPSTNVMAERASKYNIGLDATVLDGLNLTVDATISVVIANGLKLVVKFLLLSVQEIAISMVVL